MVPRVDILSTDGVSDIYYAGNPLWSSLELFVLDRWWLVTRRKTERK
jgi:hypothetical protein